MKIPRRLLAHLRRWKRLDQAAPARKGRPINTIIHHGGEPITTKVTKSFKAIVRDAGRDGPTPHWLRHTCATWLVESGADMWDAAAFTGMTTAVLERRDGHHRPDHQSSALAATRRRLRRI
ncbi:MAG: tyrosine-type recombinase/integrase [Pseudomonadota bacterium]